MPVQANGPVVSDGSRFGTKLLQSDFARLKAETKASEATAQKEYDIFMTDSEVDKESKITAIEHETAKKQYESQAMFVNKADLEGTQKELGPVFSYFGKIEAIVCRRGSELR